MAAKRTIRKKRRSAADTKPGLDAASLLDDEREQLQAQKEELQHAQSELEESRNRYAELYDRAPIAYVTLSAAGQILEINLTGAALLGCDREHLKGGLITTFAVDRNHLEKLLAHLRRCRAGETSVTTPLSLKALTGGTRQVELVSQPQQDEQATLFLTAIVDWTEQREIEQRLRQKRERLDAALNAAALGTFAWNIKTNALEWDANLDALFGLPRRKTPRLLDEFLAVVHSEDRPKVEEQSARCAHEGEDFEMEFRTVWPDGSVHWIYDKGKVFRDDQGTPDYMAGACLDVTERKRAEQELERARDEALTASRAKDNFLAALSHELRTPLNPVLLLASEEAQNPELPEEVRADFDIIRKNVELEARLIDDLLDLRAIEQGKMSLELRDQDIHAILRSAVANVRTAIDQKGITLTLNFAAAEPVVLGDDVRLQQVFWNVLMNAVKFTAPGRKITVVTSLSPAKNRLVIKVIDTGIGMNCEELARVFDPFTQGDHAEVDALFHFGGMGLGLTIARTLVELHKGSIRADSPGLGQGSTLTIELPLAAASRRENITVETSPGNATAARNGATPAPRRILLVEDHEPTRATLAHLLIRRHFEVITACSIAEARALAEKESFDLVVSDIGLPDGNGHSLMQELRDRFGLKGIALTGYGTEQDIARSQAAGFVAHLTKPVRVQSLESALAAAGAR